MSLNLSVVRRGPIVALVAVACLVAVGCDQDDEIRSYRVAKPHVLAKSNGPPAGSPATKPAEPRPSEMSQAIEMRMLTAIVPRGETAWFFVMRGPAAATALEADRFDAFVRSLKVADEVQTPPTWTLPEGWQQKPGNEMRHATITATTPEGAVDLSIMQLPMLEADLDTYVLNNINRWRDQLGLPPAERGELDQLAKRVPIEGGEAILSDLAGRGSPSGAMAAPFARGGAVPPPGPAVPGPAAAAQGPMPAGPQPPGATTAAQAALQYDVPSGWRALPAERARRAAFAIAEDDQTAEVTVIALGGAAGGLVANVNRWREQVGLPAIDEAEVERSLVPFDVGPLPAEFVEVIGTRSAILSVIVPHGDQTWFIKMTGDPPLVAREKANFETFARSVRFDGR